MNVPAEIRAGDSVSWSEAQQADNLGNAITSATWTLTTYFRFAAAGEGVTITGVAAAGGGWTMTIPAATSAAMDAGTWYWQSAATLGSQLVTCGAGTMVVAPSMAYSGTPASFDGRSQAEQDLAAVQLAIRSLISRGAAEYTIGTRRFKSNDLAQLMERESRLKAIVARERAAEKVAAGLGDPGNVFVRFR